MIYIYIGAFVVFGTLAGIVAYLYREGAIAQGKSEIGLGPLKIKLGVRQNGEKSA
ncbi:MAG: hypothetical protein JW850_12780 [Thermoflexales bacterium]|nr:hypothetical protein [Thermoflexales bacterium]